MKKNWAVVDPFTNTVLTEHVFWFWAVTTSMIVGGYVVRQ